MAEEDLFLQEVNEELNAERLRQWWQRFGSWVMAACVALVLGTIGYQYYQNGLRQANEEATSLIISSASLLEGKQYDAAAKKLLALPDNAGGVALLARLQAADALTEAGNHEAAQKEYETIAAAKTQPALAGYAQLRLGKAADVKPDAPYAALAQELRATELYTQDKKDEARNLLQSLANSPETPPAARNRVNELLAAFQ